MLPPVEYPNLVSDLKLVIIFVTQFFLQYKLHETVNSKFGKK